MRACEWAALAASAAALLALAAGAARRADMDFEFDDGAEGTAGPSARHKPHRYLYDPHNSLCRSLVCKKREVCLLRDAFTPICATKKEILLKGDTIVAASGGPWGSVGDDDVFYDAGADGVEAGGAEAGGAEAGGAEAGGAEAGGAARCVGCGARARGQFLCGSDNRTYSSLCRLDLHNCVRRGAAPVRLACRGFCPCPPRPDRTNRRTRRPRPQQWQVAGPASSRNEVLPERRRAGGGAGGCELDKMADRLLDWFSVLMEQARAPQPPRDGFPGDCKPEVRWMFLHLDTDGDGLLSATNLYALSECRSRTGTARGRGSDGRVLQDTTSASAACGRSWRRAGAGAGWCRARRGARACGGRRGRAGRWRGRRAGAGAGAEATCRRATRAATTGRASATRRWRSAGAWTRWARSCPGRAPRARPPAPEKETIWSRARRVKARRPTTRTHPPAAATASCASSGQPDAPTLRYTTYTTLPSQTVLLPRCFDCSVSAFEARGVI